MTKPVVYITQIPNRRDAVSRMLVPAVDVTPAGEHGEIKVLMPPKVSFFATADLVRQLRSGLRDYNYERGDSIVALGDPAIIAATAAVVSERSRNFSILRWDNLIKRYIKVAINL